MPTRILREGILTSEKVNRLSERAELFYRRLMSVADDYGRFYAHPSILRASCYPLRLDEVKESDVKKFLKECIDVGVLTVYGQGKYIHIDKFRQQTRSPSKFLEPTEDDLLIKCESDSNQMCSESESETKSKTYTKSETDLVEIPKEISTPEFTEAWGRWVQHRKEIKHALTPMSMQMQLKKCTEMGLKRSIDAINNSIEKGYQGIYEATHTGANAGRVNGQAPRPNPRNVGVIVGPTNYATAKPRLQREREEADRLRREKEAMAGQMALPEANPPSTQGG